MATAQPVKFTCEDYRTAPPDKRYELLDGDLLTTPAPNLEHQEVQCRLGRRLAQFTEERALGKFFFAPCDVVLSDTDVVQPDLLFVSRDRRAVTHGRRSREPVVRRPRLHGPGDAGPRGGRR